MLDYLKPDSIAIRLWNKNGNRAALDAYLKLKAREQQEILDYLRSLPTHLEIEVNGQRLYLVYGFTGANVHDEVWCRLEQDTPNPIPECQLIIGHTPVQSLMKPEEEKLKYALELESRGEHLRICHAEVY